MHPARKTTPAPSAAHLFRLAITGGYVLGLVALMLVIGPGCHNVRTSAIPAGDPFAEELSGDGLGVDRRELEVARQHLSASTAEHERKDRELAELRDRCDRLQRLADAAQAYIAENTAAGPALPRTLRDELLEIATVYGEWVRFEPETSTLFFQADFTFAPGRFTLTADAAAALSELAQALNAASQQTIDVLVAAHTDRKPISDPAAPRQSRLNAAERAMSVVEALQAGGVPTDTLAIAAWGDARPVTSNDDPAGRSANRRVELRVLPRAGAGSTTASLDWEALLSE